MVMEHIVFVRALYSKRSVVIFYYKGKTKTKQHVLGREIINSQYIISTVLLLFSYQIQYHTALAVFAVLAIVPRFYWSVMRFRVEQCSRQRFPFQIFHAFYGLHPNIL